MANKLNNICKEIDNLYSKDRNDEIIDEGIGDFFKSVWNGIKSVGDIISKGFNFFAEKIKGLFNKSESLENIEEPVKNIVGWCGISNTTGEAIEMDENPDDIIFEDGGWFFDMKNMITKLWSFFKSDKGKDEFKTFVEKKRNIKTAEEYNNSSFVDKKTDYSEFLTSKKDEILGGLVSESSDDDDDDDDDDEDEEEEKSNTGLWITIAILAVALIALFFFKSSSPFDDEQKKKEELKKFMLADFKEHSLLK